MSENFVDAAAEQDIGENGVLAVQVNGWHVLISRVDDDIHAMNDRCTHAASPLSTGRVRRGAVMCPLHGARFDLASGKCIGGAHRDIRMFPVKVEGGRIWLALPDHAPGMDELPVSLG